MAPTYDLKFYHKGFSWKKASEWKGRSEFKIVGSLLNGKS